MSKWVLRLFEIDGSSFATGREGLAAKAAAERAQGKTVLGKYLQAYDAEAYDGRGYVEFTPNVTKAMKFDSITDALECWKRQSKKRPLRDDGEPNRPLTAFNVTPERIS